MTDTHSLHSVIAERAPQCTISFLPFPESVEELNYDDSLDGFNNFGRGITEHRLQLH